MRWISSCVVVVLLCGIAGCAADSPAGRFPQGTPVVLISVDTLRSDRLPAYGYRGVETPAIDRLRNDAILFRRAYTTVPLTLPAHTSLFSGMLPPAHGARDNIGYRVDPERSPLLQQALSEAGYATGGAVSARVLRGETGISTGFDVWDDAIAHTGTGGLQSVQRAGPETFEAIRPWLEGVADGPFLLFVHLFEPHTPYKPPEPYASRFESAYDGEIAAADAVVGGLLEDLRRLGVYDRSLIVFLSDHGEGLGEHGEEEHGLFLYRTTLQVPLIVKLPDNREAGTTVEHPVSLVDVAPTILEGLGLPVAPGVDGRSLLAPPKGDETDRVLFAETLYPRLHFGWSDLAAAIRGDHQYIEAPRPELYDLEADSAQVDNLVDARADLAGDLAKVVSSWDRTLEGPEAVDAETRRQLEALGYATGASAVVDGPLPDPKDKVGVLAELHEAHMMLEKGDAAAAADRFTRVLASDPGIEDAWAMLARALADQGRVNRAIETLEEAMEQVPGAMSLKLQAAVLLFSQQRFGEARALASAAIDHDPVAARSLLAQAAVAEGDLDEAERQARAALETGPGRLGPWLALAEVLAATGRVDEAVATLLEVVADTARPADMRLGAAEKLLQQGRGSRAAEALADLEAAGEPRALTFVARVAAAQQEWGRARGLLLRVLEIRPDAARAAVDLGLIYLAEQEPETARKYLESGLESDPTLADGWNALGVIRAEGGDVEGAIEAWRTAIETEPRMVMVHYNLAMALARTGRFGEAAGHMEAFAETRHGADRDRALDMAADLRRRAD